MNIVCKASNMGCDVRCAVCGQSFLVYWTDRSRAQRARQHAEVLEALREHHAASDAERAHPSGEFTLPFEPVPMMFSAAHTEELAVAA